MHRNKFYDNMVKLYLEEVRDNPETIIPPSVAEYFFRVAAVGHLPVPGTPLTHDNPPNTPNPTEPSPTVNRGHMSCWSQANLNPVVDVSDSDDY